MQVRALLAFAVLLLLSSHQTASAIEVRGGKLEDVVVARSGTSLSTFVTEFIDGWFARGPNTFDVDKEENVYVLDWWGEKILKFDKEGKWVSSILVQGFPGTRSVPHIGTAPEGKRPRSDIAVDNWGNVYLTAGNNNILKFSPEGTLLFRLGGYGFPFVTVDKDGRFYYFRIGRTLGTVDIYSPEGDRKATILHEFEYPDRVVIQKEAGNDIYFRVNKYLMKTTLEDYLRTGKLDTAAVLPGQFRLFRYWDERVREAGPEPSPGTLIGFDTNNCFYFDEREYWYGYRPHRFCEVHHIYKCCLDDGEFEIAGPVRLCFVKGKDGECSAKGLWDFPEHKQFIVSGDGTVYFLHGTVDTVKVSKITIDEPESEP